MVAFDGEFMWLVFCDLSKGSKGLGSGPSCRMVGVQQSLSFSLSGVFWEQAET